RCDYSLFCTSTSYTPILHSFPTRRSSDLNPKDTIQFGGVVTAPIVGTIIEDSLRAMDIEPRSDGLEKDYQWPEQPKVEVPDLIGLEQAELTEYMVNLSIETNGSGSYVIDQEPKPGTKLEQGATIRIYLGEK